MFDAEYIAHELKEIGIRLRRPICIYLIGGCAMSFRQLKETTKDVDIVFSKRRDYRAFCDALFGAQYYQKTSVVHEYRVLEPSSMYENKDGFHLDLFVGRVCGKMKLSDGVVKRAEEYACYGKMRIFLVAKEDIFIFKTLASESRERDLDDMRVIYPNLDWASMLNEIQAQEFDSESLYGIVSRLEKFRAKYDLDVPIHPKVKKLAKIAHSF